MPAPIRYLYFILLLGASSKLTDAFSTSPRFLTHQVPTGGRRERPSSSRSALHMTLPRIPLIAADDTWGNWATLAGTASVAQYLGKSSKIGRLLGPPVTAMAITFALATIGVLCPGGTVAARSLQLLSLQLATPLILLGADLRDAWRRCGPLLVSFGVAASATLLACLAAWPLLGKSLTAALGGNGLIIAAALMAKNIGGGLNYMAVCSSLQASPTAIAAGLCVDNIFALVYFPMTSILASGRPDFPLTNATAVAEQSPTEEHVNVENVSLVLSISAALLWLGAKIGGSTGALPLCTLLTVLFASQAPYSLISKVQSTAQTMGVVCLYLFFSTAGAPGLAIADSVQASILPLGMFLTMLYSIHGLVLYGFHVLFGRQWKAFEVQPLLCASSAAIGGPATAVALAEAFDWKSLYVPSLLVGNIGYAIATFLGLAYHALFR